MLYKSTTLGRALSISRLYTIHYYEFDCDYSFEGEKHAFWELEYVDMGEAVFTRDGATVTLRKGNALLHAPGEFHSMRSQGASGINLFVISFDCDCAQLAQLSTGLLAIGSMEKQLLSTIITEASHAFESKLNSSYFKLRRAPKPPFGSEQLILLNLELLLIHLLRRQLEIPSSLPHLGNAQRGSANEASFSRAVAHMSAHLSRPLHVDELCRQTLLSRSKLQRLFREFTGASIMDYYIHLRMEAAKDLIRSHMHNFSEIADMLGFSSIHYFSKQFKQITGMTPTEYSASLRSLTERRSC